MHSLTRGQCPLRRHSEAQRLGGLEVDSQLKFGRLLDRQIAGFGAFEHTVDVIRPPRTAIWADSLLDHDFRRLDHITPFFQFVLVKLLRLRKRDNRYPHAPCGQRRHDLGSFKDFLKF